MRISNLQILFIYFTYFFKFFFVLEYLGSLYPGPHTHTYSFFSVSIKLFSPLILFSGISFICVYFIFNPCLLNLTICFSFFWFLFVTSVSYSHLTLTACFSFFLLYLHLSRLCLCPNLVPLQHSQRKPHTKTTEFSSAPAFSAAVRLYHAALCCSGAKLL